MISDRDIELTRRALDLAARGVGLVSPNPLVGCVVVSGDGEVVGEGTYVRNDVVHAEAIALQQAGEKARGGTAYVSLEPHDHQSKTPPCTEALIDAGITRVVCPMEDPNPLVSGNGFKHLRASGIDVVTGVLATEAERLNEKFVCWHKKGRPFVHLKLAISLDGRISLNNGVTTELSGQEALRHVHALRHEYDAILIGGNTASVDDPMLTDRSGKPRGRQLVRLILDNRLRVSTDSKLAATAGEFPTIVFSNSTDEQKVEALFQRGIQVPRIDARDLPAVLAELRHREIQSVLVEGGTQVAGAFCDAKLVDKVTLIAAPIIIGGCSAPVAIGGSGADSTAAAMHLTDVEITRLAEDIDVTGYPEWRVE